MQQLDVWRPSAIADENVQLLNARHETRASNCPIPRELGDGLDACSGEMHRELIAAERDFLHKMLRDGKITDETRRRIERDLDLEEASIGNREFRKIPL